MSDWWTTIALPVIAFMRRQNYPAASLDAYALFWRNEILPLLGPCTTPVVYPSWITDDHTPVEFSVVLGSGTRSVLRFSFEPSALPLAGDRSLATLKRTLERLGCALTMESTLDLEWFDICADELLLGESQERVCTDQAPVSETSIGIDLAHRSANIKVYFMPRIRSLISQELPEDMISRTTERLGLHKPWAAILQFLSRFSPADRPNIDIVAIDCVPASRNRLKIYFRTDIASYAQMEYFLTLGGVLATQDIGAGLRNATLIWDTLTSVSENGNALLGKASGFPGALIYYELKHGADVPSSKVYLPVHRYFRDDLVISRAVAHLASKLPDVSSVAKGYPDFIQETFPYRSLSSRTGIHTYVACTVKPGGSDVSVYYNPESFAPERTRKQLRSLL
ncbi:aromatic prenyltransferase [Mycena albidolilacea]|uniref:Aromatic prenyltransferase n=1 Tax=Mycena albidolilacea TaxID=1033008 RepID=A0AAD7AHI9_9AGAR|nr:aromatic prenyltransferase [Mycena albidolilacea]